MTTAEDLRRFGNRALKAVWDPPPQNDDTSGAPIWCLGQRYDSNPPVDSTNPPTTHPSNTTNEQRTEPLRTEEQHIPSGKESTQAASSDGGWPGPFLDDFESRVWFTYRSSFPPIPRSQDPKAASALSFAVRIRSQLLQPEGFTSDTGWGCMIRSGQSLLANALFVSKLGRGKNYRRPEMV
jgi:cysteine protease ATG4